MDDLDSKLLYKLQKEFPLTSYPFEAIATELGIDHADCLERVTRLKADGVIRQMSAIFDSRSLGYQSSLVAAKIRPEQLEAGAALISAHPGVSHNYERGHDFNLWFTLALAPDIEYSGEVARLARAAGAESWMLLPSLKTFKIEVTLDSENSAYGAAKRVEAPAQRRHDVVELSYEDKQLVRALQEDLPIQERPFLKLAAELGFTEESLFDWMAEATRRGFLRRFAAILRHRKAGFSANGMGVWAVPQERVDECGKLFASFKAVSHCYERPKAPNWPYNVFTMVHAKSEPECEKIFKELSEESKINDFRVLISNREFKKERVKYFLEDQSIKAAI